MFSKKSSLVWLLGGCSLIAVVLFRNVILRSCVNVALGYFLPDCHIQYEKVSWEKQALVLKGVQLEARGGQVTIEQAVMQGSLSFSPITFVPHVILSNPVVKVGSSGGEMGELPTAFFGLQLEASQGTLLCGDDTLFFRFQCGQGDKRTGSLVMSYDPDLKQDLLLSLDFAEQEGQIAVNFCLHETECANLVQLLSCYVPQWRQGWEHLEGTVKAKGRTLLNISSSLEEIQMEVEMESLALVNPELSVDATAQHFHGEFRFPVKGAQEEGYLPFWQRAIASCSLNECSFNGNNWGILAHSAELSLDPQADPDLKLKGTFFRGDNEYPIELLGKGSVHEDRSFWLEVNARLGEEEDIFLSLCSQEKDTYIIQGDIQNVSWSLFQPEGIWSAQQGRVWGKTIAWFRSNRIEKVQFENVVAKGFQFDQGSFEEMTGEGTWEHTEGDIWQRAAFDVAIKQGIFEAWQGDMQLIMKEGAIGTSWFRGSFDTLPIVAQFGGRFDHLQGTAIIDCSTNQLIQKITTQNMGGDEPVHVDVAFELTPLTSTLGGTLQFEGNSIGTFGVTGNGLKIENAEGWMKISTLPEKLLAYSLIQGECSFDGFFNKEMLQLVLKGEKLQFNHDNVNATFGAVENGVFNWDRIKDRWTGAIPFREASIASSFLPMKLAHGDGTLYFEGDEWQAEMTNGDVVIGHHTEFKDLVCHVAYHTGTGDWTVDKGRSHLQVGKKHYPFLIDRLGMVGDEVQFDLSLFDADRELARLSGKGNCVTGDIATNAGTHFFLVTPEVLRATFDSQGIPQEGEIQFKMSGVQMHEILAWAQKSGLGWAFPIALQDWNFNAHVQYAQGELRAVIEDPGQSFLLSASSLGSGWKIEKLIWKDLSLLGKCQFHERGLDMTDMAMESSFGHGTGNLHMTFSPFQANGSLHVQSQTPYGKWVSLSPIDWNFTLEGGITIPKADIMLKDLEARVQATGLTYQPFSQVGAVDKMAFTLAPSGIVVQGEAALLLHPDTFALEGKIEPLSLPYCGREWSLDAISFALDPKIAHFRTQTSYLNHPFFLTLGVDLASDGKALLKVQDTVESDGLTITLHNNEIERIEGTLSGVDAHVEKKRHGYSGTAAIDFTQLQWLLPKECKDLALGKGFQLSGDWIVPSQENPDSQFKGRMIGKDFEMMGYRLADLEMGIEWSGKKIKIADLHVGDPAGEFSIKQMKCLDAGVWMFEAPLVQLRDFRPSRLTQINGEHNRHKPFTISHFSLMDVQGELGDLATYVGTGTLNFINQEKKEASIFDLPLDLLKELGLDPEALTPVIGELQCNLVGNKLHFAELKNSSSEGGRSEFYLSKEGPSYLTLKGDLHIDLKMRQSAILKLVEPLTLKIRGNVAKPKYQIVP